MHSKFTFWLKHLYYFSLDFNDKLFMLRIKKYQMSYYFGALGRQKHYVETTLAQFNEMPTFIHNILNLSL